MTLTQSSLAIQLPPEKGAQVRHTEFHRAHRIGWLRAAVLGANDGIVSTASLVIGVAAAQTDLQTILVSGTAGLFANPSCLPAAFHARPILSPRLAAMYGCKVVDFKTVMITKYCQIPQQFFLINAAGK
jgi:hypothetical protein